MRIFFLLFPMFLYAQNEVCFEVGSNPYPNSSSLGCFSKYIRVLDCFDVYAESTVSDEKVLHVAAVIAELLDNDEDGEVDDLALKNKLNQENALMPVFTYDGSACMDQFMDNYNGDGVSAVLYNNEIDPTQTGHWGDDATVEEIIHTINHVGHTNIHPSAFSIGPNSSLMSTAMDIARGGQLLSPPWIYPSSAWYHYDDYTCEYECMITEYFYWTMTSILGAQEDRLDEIGHEWKLNTKEKVMETDPDIYNLLTDPQYKLPTIIPDGNYQG